MYLWQSSLPPASTPHPLYSSGCDGVDFVCSSLNTEINLWPKLAIAELYLRVYPLIKVLELGGLSYWSLQWGLSPVTACRPPICFTGRKSYWFPADTVTNNKISHKPTTEILGKCPSSSCSVLVMRRKVVLEDNECLFLLSDPETHFACFLPAPGNRKQSALQEACMAVPMWQRLFIHRWEKDQVKEHEEQSVWRCRDAWRTNSWK